MTQEKRQAQPDVGPVVSGVGVITALGIGLDDLWKGVRDGRSGVVPLADSRAAGLRSWLGAPAPWSPADSALSRRSLRGLTRGEQMLLDAVDRAFRDAGIEEVDPLRCGLFFAGDKFTSDLGAMLTALARIRGDRLEPLTEADIGAGMRATMNPLFYVEGLQSLSLYSASRHWAIKGPATYIHGSGDAGVVALRSALRALDRDEVDVAVVAAASHGTELTHLARLDAMGLFTTENELGAAACRPWDTAHAGSVLGDGAVALVLQRRGRANSVRAGVRGVGLGLDGTRAPRPDPRARGVSAAVHRAVRHAGCGELGRVSHVVGHGSGTAAGDTSEALALGALLAEQPAPVRLTSVKPNTGHLSAAAGLLNVVISVAALQHRELPALLNLSEREPDLDEIFDVDGGTLEDGCGLVITRGVEGQAGAVILDA